MTNIAIFASGTGTNARKMLEFFQNADYARIALIVSSRADAGVLDIAREFGVPSHVLNKQSFKNTSELLGLLRTHSIEWIVLAGFLWLIPPYLVQAYPRRIINIHPALLPKYGGKGMYGHFVHEAVRESGDLETGITIHFVNENYDEGDIIFQASCALEPGLDASEIARRVQVLEHEHFARVVGGMVRW